MDVLANIRASRNAIQSVNRLPLETLARVFTFLPDLVPSADLSQFQDESSLYAWTVAIRVCRRWRTAALVFPDMWNVIDTRHLDAAHTFLERSRQTPIDVFLRNTSKPGYMANRRDNEALRRFIVQLTNCVPRLRTLEIGAIETNNDFESISAFQASGAPVLERLSLCMEGNLSSRAFETELFSGKTPLLTHLTIGNLGNWPSNQFGNITQFCYCEVVETSAVLTHLAEFLTNNPRLEELFLGNSRGRPSTFQPTDSYSVAPNLHYQPIYLPRLQKLSIWSYNNKAVALITSILQLPSAVNIRLWDIFCDQTLPSIEHMFPQVANNILDLHDVSEICIERVDHASLVITCVGKSRSYNIKASSLKSSGESLTRSSIAFLAKLMETQGSKLETLWIRTSAFEVSPGPLAMALNVTTLIIRAHYKHTGSVLGRFEPLIAGLPHLETLELSFYSDRDLQPGLLSFVRHLTSIGNGRYRRISRLVLNITCVIGDMDDNIAELEKYVCEVDSRSDQTPRRMNLPEACKFTTHSHWPAWDAKSQPLYG